MLRFSTTDSAHWQIPYDCRILRVLIESNRLCAKDFCFKSQTECQRFIRHLFLLSYADEIGSGCPSPIANLGQELLHTQQQVLGSEL